MKEDNGDFYLRLFVHDELNGAPKMSAPKVRDEDRSAIFDLGTTIVPGEAGEHGYRRLVPGPLEPMGLRNDLGGSRPSNRLRTLVSFVQVSDLHVTDVQSPARAEFLDRLGDPDSPYLESFGRNLTYRAHESLSHQVVEAMAHAIRRLGGAPLTGGPISFAVSTGDATDNCQANELEKYIALLDGGSIVCPDSGDLTCFEGVGATSNYDIRYWHPDGTPAGEPDDLPRSRNGFPTVPGLLDACRAPFLATGLGLAWYAINGNHDALLGGTYVPDSLLSQIAIGGDKPFALDGVTDLDAILIDNEVGREFPSLGALPVKMLKVAPDPMRRFVDAREWIEAHLKSPGEPKGHGFDEKAAEEARAYYGFDFGEIRFLVLDTVNRFGGWQGSLDATQFQWLEQELIAGHHVFRDPSHSAVLHNGQDRLFVFLSHHAIDDLTNYYEPSGAIRYGRPEMAELLNRFPNVIAWFNGHTHVSAVKALSSRDSGILGVWQVTTPSHIDWPQQCRLVEIAFDESTGEIVIGATTMDHGGLLDPRAGELSDPLTLAGWSRELAANAWKARVSPSEPRGRGGVDDRNVVLVAPAPFKIGQR